MAANRNQWSNRLKAFVGLGTVAAAVGLSIAVNQFSWAAASDANTRVIPALVMAAEQTAIAKADVGDMGFYTTRFIAFGDKADREAKMAADERAAAAFAKADEALRSMGAPQSLVDKLLDVEAADEEGCHPLETQMVAMVEKGNKAGAVKVLREKYSPALDTLKAKADEFRVAVEAELATQVDRQSRAMAFATTLNWIALAVVGAAIVFCGWLMRQMILGQEQALKKVSADRQRLVAFVEEVSGQSGDGGMESGLETIRTEVEESRERAAALAETAAKCRASADQLAALADGLKAQSSRGVMRAEEAIEAAKVVAQSIEAVAQMANALAADSQNLTESLTSAGEASDHMTRAAETAAKGCVEMRASGEASRSAAEQGREAIDRVLDRMGGIREEVAATSEHLQSVTSLQDEIGGFVTTIGEISEQTNLLALNATIEAARAGESGRGFAVVAQEVKALAAQTASATKEISSQIDGMQVATQESVLAIKQIGATIGRISQIAATISSSVEQQGGATQEIARNVEQAALGTSEVATNIVDVNQGARRTGSASAQVLSSAQSLSGESNRLKLEVGKFLDTVRAA